MMETLGNIWNLGVKELRSIWHDKVLLAFVLMAFTLMVYTAGSAGSMGLHNAPVAVVDEDQSALAGHMIDSLQPPWFMPPDQIQYGQIDEVLDKGSHTFVLVIPDSFERDIRQGRVTSVQLNIDATRMTQAFIGSRYIEQLLTTEVAEFMRTGSAGGALPINLVTRVSFNPNLDGTWFGGVMELTNMITMITMISIILTGAALIREREHGTVEHLMVMPIKPFEIMAAKVWANGLVVMLAATLSVTLVIQQILDVPVQGSILLFMFGTLIHLFSTTAIGILIGTVARTMPQFGLLLILTILPLQMLSGGITPRESMPELVQNIMLVAPTTHFVSLAQAILYRGAGLDVVWPQMLALVAIGVVFFSVALALFRRHLAV
jgi:ABC-type multidrug transport system permease subunit